MKTIRNFALLTLAALVAGFAFGAPDEDALGKARGYPNMGTRSNFLDQPNIVGSMASMDSIYKTNVVSKGSATPLRSFKVIDGVTIPYEFQGRQGTLGDWTENNRALAVLAIKGEEILFERYQYDRKPDMKLVGFSMSKTVVAVLVGAALMDGAIGSLDDTAQTYVKELEGTDYGKVTIRNLLRMNSGIAWYEMGRAGDRDPSDDVRALADATYRQFRSAGGLQFVKRLKSAVQQGTVYNYNSADTFVLGMVVRDAVKKTLADYTSEKIWSKIGAEGDASWNADWSGVEASFAYFNARPRDWARMALWIADGAVRDGVVTAAYLNEMTASQAQPEHQKARTIFKYYGYGYQTWILPYQTRTFAFVGSWGQMIVVQPATRTVLVKFMARKTQKEDLATFQEDTYLIHGWLKNVAGSAAQIPMPR